MHDALDVHGLHAAQHGDKEPGQPIAQRRLVGAGALFAHGQAQRGAGHVLHDEVVHDLARHLHLVEVEDLEHVGVAHLRHETHLAAEAVQFGADLVLVALQAGDELLGHDLERHLPVQAQLAGQVDLTLAAGGDVPEDLPLALDDGALFKDGVPLFVHDLSQLSPAGDGTVPSLPRSVGPAAATASPGESMWFIDCLVRRRRCGVAPYRGAFVPRRRTREGDTSSQPSNCAGIRSTAAFFRAFPNAGPSLLASENRSAPLAEEVRSGLECR